MIEVESAKGESGGYWDVSPGGGNKPSSISSNRASTLDQRARNLSFATCNGDPHLGSI